jgi:hypothetical protein
MAKRMTLIVAVFLSGAGGVCRGEGALGDSIGNRASGACKNPPASQLARVRNPNRWGELTNTIEDLREIEAEWERIWIVDQPSHMVYERVRGGLE